ncbi:MAG: hypothetical protein JNJ98_09410 [Gemmatimonadetes bacterium]|nr:hypothetical protein [Gemmatimonadota bacterium]
MRIARSCAIVTACLVLASACGGNDSDAPTPPAGAALGTFDRIQGQILATTCTAGCHTQGSAFAQSSGLVLDRAVAYANLVGAVPRNAAAKADGLHRVKAFRADSSLLYHKLVIADGHHSPAYGSPMPLGGQVITNGELEFIRRWIEAGAPERGNVVDTMVLADRARPVATPFTPLAPPPQGVQLKIEPFSVSPNFERELFVYRRVNNASDLFVDRIETRMRTNSHHLLLYTFENIPPLIRPSFDVLRDIRHPDGTLNLLNMLPMGFHVFFAGTQTPTSDYRFPAGVALRVPAQGTLDLNSHYVNRTTAPLTGEAYINLHTVPAASVQRVARTLNLGNTDLTLPPGTRTTVSKTFRVSDSTMTIFMLTSHMHERGERFVVKVTGGPRDGEVVYTTTDWAHPDIINYAQPIVLRRGEGLTSEITYNNTTTRTIRFGLTSADEMGIIFGYYY